MKNQYRLLIIALGFVLSSMNVFAESAESAAEPQPDLANGERLHRTCALCHGRWSQGIQGGRYPRLAGRSFASLQKELHDFRQGIRMSQSMNVVGRVKQLTAKDMFDLNSYIASINLDEKYPLDIPVPAKTDVAKGEELFQDDCKTCHGRKAEGKDSKDSPRLAGQRTGYMLRQVQMFRKKDRHHDNDPDDETFEDYSDQDIHDIMAYIATLDDKKDNK